MKLIKDFDPSLAPSGVLDTKGINANEQLMLYNDSLNGLQLTFPDGSVDVIPPSWNKDFIIETVPMAKVAWKVYNTITAIGYPISQVYGTIYEPGEHVARVNAGMQRGFQITGGAIAVGNTSVSNEGNPINTLFVDGGPTGNLNMIQIYNDHFLWSVVQAGVAHQVFKGNISGNPLQIGQIGDIVEMLGNALVDGTFTVTGSSTMAALAVGPITTVAPCSFGAITVGGIFMGAGDITMSGHNIIGPAVVTGGLTLTSGSFDLQSHNIINVGTIGTGVITYTAGSTSRKAKLVKALVLGTQTVTHSLGWSADKIDIIGTSPSFSATVGWNACTTTTVSITVGAAGTFDINFEKF